MTQGKHLEQTDQTNLKYGDERASDETQVTYPGARQKPDWIENNNLLQFINRLESLNEPLAERINYQENLKDMDKEFAKHIAMSFNQTNFSSRSERYETAQELTQQIFKPLWHEVEKPLDFTRMETDQKIETTGEKLDRSTAVSELMYRQHIFAKALYEDEPDSKFGVIYNIQMEQTLRDPLTYPKHDEQDYPDKLFDWLKENENTFGSSASLRLAEVHLAKSRDHASGYPPEPDRNARMQLIETTQSVTQNHHRRLEDAISQSNVESFKKILEEMPRRDHELCREIKENTGFTNLMNEERPDLPGNFHRLEQAEAFAGQINSHAPTYQDPARVENPDIREAIDSRIKDFNRELENQQKMQTEYPETADWWFEDYDRLHDIAKTLDYLTRPNEPDFWKMVDHQDGVTEHILRDYAIESATSSALDAIFETLTGEDEVKAALNDHKVIAQTYETEIISDVEKEDIGSYQTHIKAIEDRSQAFARDIRNGTLTYRDTAPVTDR